MERGGTWDTGRGGAGDLLASLFVNPTRAFSAQTTSIDPDRPLLKGDWARSALLFGPPGTGKTILARAVAKDLGWPYIEITPADVLDRGTEFVSARADEIFRKLLEVDRAVVLFDEIDELIRSRGQQSDMLGRFFTTTMLPRLARLWDARRVIFFVNTNSVQHIDPAVRRSQRFDAAIFIMPPSLERKLDKLDATVRAFAEGDVISSVLSSYGVAGEDGAISAQSARIAWLAFLRYDQLVRLGDSSIADQESFFKTVEQLGNEVVPDWALVEDGSEDVVDSPSPDAKLKWILAAYRKDLRFQRIDPTRVRVIGVPDGVTAPGWLDHVENGFGILNDGGSVPAGALDGAAGLVA